MLNDITTKVETYGNLCFNLAVVSIKGKQDPAKYQAASAKAHDEIFSMINNNDKLKNLLNDYGDACYQAGEAKCNLDPRAIKEIEVKEKRLFSSIVLELRKMDSMVAESCGVSTPAPRPTPRPRPTPTSGC